MAAAASPVSNNPPIFLQDYNLTEKLGKGSYGEVYKAYRKFGSREVVAIKCMSRAQMSKSMQDRLITEIRLMKELRHDYIVQLVDHRWDKHYIYIIMEYCGGGDLSRFIRSKACLPEEICQRFLQQVASALQYLHSKNVVHMDLKPANLLLTGGKNPIVKVADFGFATHLAPDQTKSTMCGSPLYMAPEILEGKYDARVDLWSIGVILFECLFGHAPFKSGSAEEVYAKIREARPVVIPRNPPISPPCRELLTKCLKRSPEERISFVQFFAHPFLDLEHAPTDESERKLRGLVDQGRLCEEQNNLSQALVHYTAALNYLVPLVKHYKGTSRGQTYKKMTLNYMERAEDLKAALQYHGDTVQSNATEPIVVQSKVQRLQKRSVSETSTLSELQELARVTPRLATGLEIARLAEEYEFELNYKSASEKYEAALAILLEVLKSEPSGRRKTLLGVEVKRWLTRAEEVKRLKEIQDEVLAKRMALYSADESDKSKNCSIQ